MCVSEIRYEEIRESITSRPSQNSFSVMCPPITSSLCNAASSGLLRRTFFRRRKSAVGSLVGVLEVRASLATEAARDGLGKASDTREAGTVGVAGVDGVPGACVGAGVGRPERLAAMMAVSSFLNFSRSFSATACGEMNVKLCPASFPTKPTFSLTCAAPSLLQKRAFKCESTRQHHRRYQGTALFCTDTPLPHEVPQLQISFYHLASITNECL